ncbi:MAG: MFS transporter [Solobacterium sp.]|nr:MFS transporter [Solobacterium sp.]
MKLKISALNIVYFGIQAPFIYLSSYALALGVRDDLLSVLIGISFLAAFFGQVFWGTVSDRIRSTRKIMIMCTLLSIADFIALWSGKTVAVFAVAYTLLGFFISPALSVLDSWSLDLLDYDSTGYGNVKSAGAVGFAAAMLVLGWLIERIGFSTLFLSGLFFCVLCILLSLSLPDKRFAASAGGEKPKMDFSILRNRTFILLLVSVFLLGLAIAPPNNLKILLIQQAGGTVSAMGIDNGIGYAVQALMYAAAGHLSSRHSYLHLGLGALVTGIGMLLAAFAGNIWMVYLSTFCIYGAFSVENTVIRMLSRKLFPPEYLTTVLSIIDAVFMQLGGFIGLVAAGGIIAKTSLFTLMIICFALCIGSIFTVTFMALQKKA